MTIARPAALLLSVLAFALPATLSWAAGPGILATPTGMPPALPDGEVIVGFKPGAATLRKHALAARSDAATARSALSDRATTLGARLGRTLQAGAAVGEHAQVVRAAGVDAATLARQLATDPDVAYAVPNGRKRIVAAPNDPLYLAGPAVSLAQQTGGPASGQWYLRAPDSTIKSAIDIEAAWLRTTGSSNVVVAVLDTGVRFEHPDLGRVANGGQLLPGYDFVNDVAAANDGDGRDGDPSDPGDWTTAAENNDSSGLFYKCGPLNPQTGQYERSDSSWHGTATSSIVAARTNEATGMAGVAPGVQLLPVRVLGKCFGVNSDILAAMRWAAGIDVPGVRHNDNPAKVINMSLGGGGACTADYQSAVDEIMAQGVTIVAAAGNSAGGPVSEPANCRGVIGVLALRHAGTKVGFSDLGPEITIAAPGGNCINITAGSACLYPIVAATNTGPQGPVASSWTNSFDITVGTSFSSPLVAGVAALMVSRQPALTPAQLSAAMQATARPFPTTGADNGPNDNTPVTACQAPTTAVVQQQCYCSTGLCGAGMLDAGRSVAAATDGVAVAEVTTAAPVAGRAVTLSGAKSLAPAGTSITQYVWTVESTGGIVGAFDGTNSLSTANITPTGAGSFTVRLLVRDSLGNSNTTTQTVTVAAAPAPADTGGGGGGGSTSAAWVAGVGLAAAVLQLLRSRAIRAARRRV